MGSSLTMIWSIFNPTFDGGIAHFDLLACFWEVLANGVSTHIMVGPQNSVVSLKIVT